MRVGISVILFQTVGESTGRLSTLSLQLHDGYMIAIFSSKISSPDD